MLIIDTFNNMLISYAIMTKRVTIMIDDDNDKKLRNKQAKQITQQQGSISFSRVINEVLRKALK